MLLSQNLPLFRDAVLIAPTVPLLLCFKVASQLRVHGLASASRHLPGVVFVAIVVLGVNIILVLKSRDRSCLVRVATLPAQDLRTFGSASAHARVTRAGICFEGVLGCEKARSCAPGAERAWPLSG